MRLKYLKVEGVDLGLAPAATKSANACRLLAAAAAIGDPKSTRTGEAREQSAVRCIQTITCSPLATSLRPYGRLGSRSIRGWSIETPDGRLRQMNPNLPLQVVAGTKSTIHSDTGHKAL